MRHSLIQQNKEEILSLKESLRDELYSIYFLEYQSRGEKYFSLISMLPTITDGVLNTNTPITFVRRLAINPSVMSLLFSKDPIEDIERAIFSEISTTEATYINDFLDDITMNVLLRNPDLYNRNKDVFLKQILLTKERRTNMDKDQDEKFKRAYDRFEPILLTLHYLRKIGYNHGFNEIRSET